MSEEKKAELLKMQKKYDGMEREEAMRDIFKNNTQVDFALLLLIFPTKGVKID